MQALIMQPQQGGRAYSYLTEVSFWNQHHLKMLLEFV